MTAGAWRLPPADDQRPTYLAHVIALTALHGPGPLPHGGYPLPDEDHAQRRPLLSGAVLDGVRTHHCGVDTDEPAAAMVARLIDDLVAGPPTTTALQHLHDIAADQDPLPIADAVTSELTARDLPTERLRQIGRWLAEYGTGRNAVALGILLLGAGRRPPRPRSAARAGQPGRHGFRNQIMDEYLAHVAATTGDLYGALTTPPVDDELLDGAGDILTALCCCGGPANDITDYPEAPQTIDRYLILVAQRPPSLTRVAVVLRLAWFIASDQAVSLNWTDTTRTRLRRTCDRLVEQPDWLLAVAGSGKWPTAVLRRMASSAEVDESSMPTVAYTSRLSRSW
jgi:hypothetical protein